MTNNEMFAQSVNECIVKNNKRGFGKMDCVKVIMDVLANETGAKREDMAEIEAIVKAVVNPSEFRQALENKGKLEKSEGGKRSSAVKGLIDSL